MFSEKEVKLIQFLVDYHLRMDVDFALSADTATTANTILKKINYCLNLTKKTNKIK